MSGRNMMMLLVKKPSLFEAASAVLEEIGVEATKIEEDAFLKEMKKEAPQAQALLATVNPRDLQIFKNCCDEHLGGMFDNGELTTLLFPA